jgi:signal transduction histidine kinase
MNAAKTSQKTVFRPRARLISLLGEQLISDQAIGLIELVKNAYDADATNIRIELAGLKDIKTTRVLLQDNGSGMTRDDIEQKWLSPAVNHKERQKKNQRRTPRGRLPIGEKGVGRFAVQKLGRRLTLISRAAQAPEVVVEIDWDDFDREDAYLSEIEFSIDERSPEIFTGNTTGTLLIIEHARTLWNENLLAKIQRALRRLQSPHQENKKTDFSITFTCSDFPVYENISNTDILDRAHYTFEGMVDEKGVLAFEYNCLHPSLPKRSVIEDEEDLIKIANREMHSIPPSCGPFYLNFYVWDRSSNYLQQSNVSRADLDAIAGVSIFRDKLRILPYGEAGNDWLDLDKERINNMANRIGNQQIVGFVEIFQDQTPHLRDKTDRQGLIDNDAFQDLRALVRAALNVFTSHWFKDRPRSDTQNKEKDVDTAARASQEALKKAATLVQNAVNSSGHTSSGTPPPSPVPAFTPEPTPGAALTRIPEISASQAPLGLQPVSARTEPVRDLPGFQTPEALSTSPFTPVEAAPQPDLKLAADSEQGRPPVDPSSEESFTPELELLELLNLLNTAARYQEQSEARTEQQQQMLMHLAMTGMAAERVAHEFGRQVNAAISLLKDLRTLNQSNKNALNAISALEACINMLRNEAHILAPYEVHLSVQRTRLVSILDSIQNAVTLNKRLLEASAIDLEIQGSSFDVFGRPASLVQVLDNLINNACFWLENHPGIPHICIILDPLERIITIEDNGPGIPRHLHEEVFLPFISTRNGGRGLGLYIARSLLNTMRASIELDIKAASGTRFILQFPKPITRTTQK